MIKSKKNNCLFLFFAASIFVFAFYCLFPVKMSAGTNWYNNNWSYRKEITIDHAKVPNTDQLNFPVLISLTDSDLQSRAKSDGYDILFTDSTGIVKIPYEREQYVSATGTLVAWVNVANLSHTTDTIIYIYYGNSEAGDQQNISGGTWNNNFKAVWHSGDATSTTISDSTSNANTGTKYGSAGPIETTGKIGNAQNYNGSDDYIGIIPSETISGSFTISTWAKVSDSDQCTDNASCTVIGTRGPVPNDQSFDFKFYTGNIIHGDIGDGNDWISNGADVDPNNFSYSTDTWYQITYVVTDTGYTIYVNGNDVADGTYDTPGTPLFFDSNHNLYIGQVGYDDEWFNGAIDEVRLSDVARSADWIQIEYSNENNPSEFYSLGSEESAPSSDATLSGIAINGTALTDFVSTKFSYDDVLPAGATAIPIVVATTNNSGATAVVTESTNLPGLATILITAADGLTTQTYTINFTVAPVPVVVPPSAPVISVGGGNMFFILQQVQAPAQNKAPEIPAPSISQNVLNYPVVDIVNPTNNKPTNVLPEKTISVPVIPVPAPVFAPEEKPAETVNKNINTGKNLSQPAGLLGSLKNIMSFGTGEMWILITTLLIFASIIIFGLIYFFKKT